MQSASDTFSQVLIICSNWYKHCVRHRDGEKWIGHARLIAEVPSTSIEYSVKCIKHQKELDPCGFPGPLFIPTLNLGSLGNVLSGFVVNKTIFKMMSFMC